MKIIESDYISVRKEGRIAVLTLDREEKRNAVCDALIQDIDRFLRSIDASEVSALVVCGAGKHFCAGLDLAEHKERAPFDGVLHSRFWHEALDVMEFGPIPVVSALQGGVIGGGLEIASATHVRVAEPTAFFQLPEGRRGIYVGGGASVRVQRIIGFDRMREMMLTGRKYDAEEGVRLGLAHYLVGEGEAFERAMVLADDVAGNAKISNYMMINALPRIADMDRMSGSFTETIAAALSQTSEDAKRGIEAFLAKRDIRFDRKG
jgi:enoyl-CoA hydratase/carnithine racemase